MSSPTRTGKLSAAGFRPDKQRNGKLFFILPAAAFLSVLSIFPLFQLVRMSLSNVTAATLNKEWIFTGLDNFIRGFESGETTTAMVRTGIFVLVVTIVGMFLGLAAAISLRTSGRWSATLLAIMVFVWALPPVVNGSVWKFLLGESGFINTLLKGVGLIESSIPFLYDQYWALASVAFVNSWAVIPFNALVFRSALLGIETEIFEAASLDGASKWDEIKHIMLPAAKPTTLVLFVLTVVYAFRSFDFIYVMTYGGPGTATNTLPFLGYLQAFVQFDFGLGSATSIFTVLFVLILAVVYAQNIRREERY